VTRSAEVKNMAVAQGPLAAGGGGNVQAATCHGIGITVIGWVITRTLGIEDMGMACPP